MDEFEKLPFYKQWFITIKKNYAVIIICIIAVFLMYFTGYGCLIRHVIHHPCPSCGVSRAWICLLHGHIKEALEYHPLFLFLPLFVLCCVSHNIKPISYIPRKIQMVLFVLGLFLIALVYIYRVINGFGPV